MGRAVAAGGLYFAFVFAAGFALGTLRVLVLAPALGDTGAVALELPLMLAISWLACGVVLRRLAVPATVATRLVMGGFAFALLIGAETALGVLGFGRTLGEQIATWRALPAQLGLVAQLAFALFPLARIRIA
jgi:hypothetical protein